MGRPWLLSLPLLLLSLPCLALPQPCNQADLQVIDGGRDLQPVLTVTTDEGEQKDQLSYLQPQEGFQGVSVEVEGGVKMYFKTQDDCFALNDTDWWWKAEVYCEFVIETHNIACHLLVGDCYLQCRRFLPGVEGLPGHRWVTHGPARWRSSTPPRTCVVKDLSAEPSQWDDICRNDPPVWHRPDTASRTADTTRHAKPLWVIAVVMVVVVVVVVVVMVVRHRKGGILPYSRLSTPSQAPAPGPISQL